MKPETAQALTFLNKIQADARLTEQERNAAVNALTHLSELIQSLQKEVEVKNADKKQRA